MMNKLDPVVALQEVLSENERLKNENESLRESLRQISKSIPSDLRHQNESGTQKDSSIFERKTDELELTLRTYNCIKNDSIDTVCLLVQQTEDGLLRSNKYGRKTVDEIKEILEGMGLRLGMTTQDISAWPNDQEKKKE